MKKLVLIALAVFAAQGAAPAAGAEKAINVLLAGGAEDNLISITLGPEGRTYVIDSTGPLEIGGSVCANPPGNPNELICQAPAIAGFEVNAGAGNDRVVIAREVAVPVTLRGGAGNDELIGGGGSDSLTGNGGNDRLVGRAGNDSVMGGEGDDRLVGGSGNDWLRGGPGNDELIGGSGANDVLQ
jgi:Ca2+-binding RTX toxin-like protein